MPDAEWAAVRLLPPVPAWLQGWGGQPEGCCHRRMLDAIRYLVAGGICWWAMPADFPVWGRPLTRTACQWPLARASRVWRTTGFGRAGVQSTWARMRAYLPVPVGMLCTACVVAALG
ncbi:transposase [Streptomyces noursei]|uniref:transposase n=1 Tax=Streptomyces noursei TaxID=1971 RepID=UPI00381621BC